MPRAKLTDALIASSLPQEKVYDLNDTEIPGLQCVINPKGKKTFKLRVKNVQKQIGRYPLMKCAEARKIALIWHGELIREGTLESKEEQSSIKEITVDDLIKEYLDYRQSSRHALETGTLCQYKSVWKKHLSPALGQTLVSKLTDIMVNGYLASLSQVSSRINASRNILKPALEHGEKMGYAVPVLRPEKWLMSASGKRERYFTSGELSRLQEIINELNNTKGKRRSRYKQLTILEILMYTGCRCGEILKMRWEDVFLEEGYIQLWKTKTKKGRIIPIVAPIDDLILKTPRVHNEPYVFFSTIKSSYPLHYGPLSRFWRSVMKKGNFNDRDIEHLTIHSLRHTYITAAHRSGISPWTIAALAGHSVGNSVTGLYIHHNLSELKKAQDQIVYTLNNGTY